MCAAGILAEVPGSYSSIQTVTITSTSGATIHYTTDGSTPSETEGTVYSTPVVLSQSCPLQAFAYQSGMADSSVTAGTYSLQSAGSWLLDTTTQGSWWSSGGGYRYGSGGYVLCAWNSNYTDVVSLTGSYVQSVTPTGQGNCCWAANQSDVRDTINPATGTRNAACWYTTGSEDCLVTLNTPGDGILHRMAVYCLDWDSAGRSQTIDLLNPSTGLSELNNGPVPVSNFQNGVWVVFYFTGNVQLHIVNGGINAVISAIAFDNSARPRSSTRCQGVIARHRM